MRDRIKGVVTAVLVFPFILIGIWFLIIMVSIIGMPNTEHLGDDS